MRPFVAAFLTIGLISSGHAASVKQYTSDDCSGTAIESTGFMMFADGKHFEINETAKSIDTERLFDNWYAFEDTDACSQEDGDIDQDSVLGVLKNGCHNVDTFIPGRRVNCVKLESNALT